MFNKLPKKIRYDGHGRRITSMATSIAGRLYEKAMDNVYVTKGRRPEYRPSSFPICGILTFMKLIKGCSIGRFEQDVEASGDYFCSVGTTAHENIQFHMGFSKMIFGDWRCKNYECDKGADGIDIYNKHGELIRKGKLTARNTTNNICPCCKQPMHYEEKEIRFNGLCGHIDGIIEQDDGTYWVIDYKTTTKYILKNEKLPKASHLKQLSSYCYVLEKKYKLKISGFSLLYFSRDNPFEYKECEVHWDDGWRVRSKTTILEAKHNYISALKAFRVLKLNYIIEHKQCRSKKFYLDKIAYYEECPMLDVCFDEKKLRQSLHAHIEEYPTEKKDRVALVKSIGLLEKRK